VHANTNGRQLEYICIVGMGKMLGVRGMTECTWQRLSMRITCIYDYYSLLLNVKYGDVMHHIVDDDLSITTSVKG